MAFVLTFLEHAALVDKPAHVAGPGAHPGKKAAHVVDVGHVSARHEGRKAR